MKCRFRNLLIGSLLLSSISASMGFQALKLPTVFGDNMVLQRDMEINIWGWGEPDAAVQVELAGLNAESQVNASGEWQVALPALPAGGPYDLMIMSNDTLVVKNILLGELWICSGQSNMGMTVGGSSRINNYKQEIAAADYPHIRLFTVEKAMAAQPLGDVESRGWFPVTPESIENFSATAYFFGRNLQAGLEGVPIGLIHTSWGGTRIEAWTSAGSLESEQVLVDEIAAAKKSSREQDEAILAGYKSDHSLWLADVDSVANDLAGDIFEELTSPRAKNSWSSMDIPTFWEQIKGLEKYDGLMWFKRQVTLPEAWSGKDLFLSLGTVDDNDWTYLNGTLVGQNMASSKPSEYFIAADQHSTGEHTLAVRVLDVNRRGGLWGRTQDLLITAPDSKDTLWLSGSWAYKPILNTVENKIAPPERPYLHNRPTVLYNAMIAPLTRLSIRGVIWYQGEANASKAHDYRSTFPLLIKDWRKAWGQGDFPFLYVQLPNWGKRKEQPSEDRWAELRDAQLKTLSLANTSMAVTIDIGDERDIHPKNKQEVGKRLAFMALKNVYGQAGIIASGPMYQSHAIRWGRVIVKFDGKGGKLTTTDGQDPKGFSIAGSDGVFHWAHARLRGDKVILSSKEVIYPVAIRYAWAANPDCNLTDASGLPASPFKTDSWKNSTE